MATPTGECQQRRPVESSPSQAPVARARLLEIPRPAAAQYATSISVTPEFTRPSATLARSSGISAGLSSVLVGATITFLLAQPSPAAARPNAPAAGATAGPGIVSGLMGAPSEEQLDALASSGIDRLLPYSARSAPPAIRAIAAYAARLVPDGVAARGLIQTLLRDVSPLVREAAVLAAAHHADEEILLLLQTIASDSTESPGVRLTAADVLADLQQQ